MTTARFDSGALLAGLVFIALGVMFLLDRLGVWALQVSFVWPVLLIGIGLAILFGRQSRS